MKHREITQDTLQLALTDPDQVNWDKALERVEVFYRELLLSQPHGWSLMKVCVHFEFDEYEGVEVGTVTSAYTAFNMSDLERCKWSRDGHCP